MATTTYPCPCCSQAQRIEHEIGSQVESLLCAACEEEADALGFKGKPLERARKLHDAHKLESKS